MYSVASLRVNYRRDGTAGIVTTESCSMYSPLVHESLAMVARAAYAITDGSKNATTTAIRPYLLYARFSRVTLTDHRPKKQQSLIDYRAHWKILYLFVARILGSIRRIYKAVNSRGKGLRYEVLNSTRLIRSHAILRVRGARGPIH